MAQNLARHGTSVEVLTTCADNHFTWSNDLPAGETTDGEVRVRRFAVSSERSNQRWLDLHTQIALGHATSYADQLEWMANSVWSEELNDAAADRSRYDWVIGIPYLFGTTFWTAASRPDRTCLIPCVHDERHAWQPVVRSMLSGVRGSLLNSHGESLLFQRLAPHARWRVVGVGYDDEPVPSRADVEAFCANRNIAPGYLLYAGRREVAKGVPLLFDHYRAFREQSPGAPPLALMGAGDLPVPEDLRDCVIELGFVPTEDRATAYAGAAVLLHPSRLESLGMVMLEAWLTGTPALVNSGSPVLVDHCRTSGGGLWFDDVETFCLALEQMLTDDALRDRLATAGREYTRTTFSWEEVRRRLLGALEEWE